MTVQARGVAAVSQGRSQLDDYESSYSVEVLATNGAAPTRVKVVFERNLNRTNGLDVPTVIDGKTYVVDEAAPHVRDVGGGPVSAVETVRVLDVFPELGMRTQIDQILPDTSMEIGDERQELAGAILRVVHPRAWKLNRGSASLTRTDGDEAVFAITIDATGGSGIRIDVSGDARVRLRDARLTSFALDGTYAMTTPTPSGTNEPDGTLSLRRTVRDL